MARAAVASVQVADKTAAASTEVSPLTEADIKKIVADLNRGAIDRQDLPAHTNDELALVAEVLLEQGRDQWFDDDRAFTGGKFTDLVAEQLGISVSRAANVMKIMRQHQAYSLSGRKVIFAGTARARDIVASLEADKVIPPVSAPPVSGIGATAPTGATAPGLGSGFPPPPPPFMVGYTGVKETDRDLPFPVAPRHQIGTTLVLEGLMELTGRDKLLANIVVDRIITDTGGDPELVAGVLYELATRVGHLI